MARIISVTIGPTLLLALLSLMAAAWGAVLGPPRTGVVAGAAFAFSAGLAIIQLILLEDDSWV